VAEKHKLYLYSQKAIEHGLPNTVNKEDEQHMPDHHQTDTVGCRVLGKVFLFSSVNGFKPLGFRSKNHKIFNS